MSCMGLASQYMSSCGRRTCRCNWHRRYAHILSTHPRNTISHSVNIIGCTFAHALALIPSQHPVLQTRLTIHPLNTSSHIHVIDAFTGISQRLATYQAKTAFVVTGAADKVLKRWALPVHTLAALSSTPG